MKVSLGKVVKLILVSVFVTIVAIVLIITSNSLNSNQDNISLPPSQSQPRGSATVTVSVTPKLIISSNSTSSQRKRVFHRQTSLNDLFISVKTTRYNHESRIPIILNTWFTNARHITYFFTDQEDELLKTSTGNHLINTNCSAVHNRHALCCKMAVEFDFFVGADKRWFCHVDDDSYVHVGRLLKFLQSYNHTGDWYLGKPSLTHPMEVKIPLQVKSSFWFATGGAGFCLSRGLALKMIPYAGGGKLKTVCDRIKLPDDCTIGYIISEYLKKNLVVVPEMHSHLEGLHHFKEKNLNDQITLSYGRYGNNNMNTVDVKGFNKSFDPTRFYSIHCKLYPQNKMCSVLKRGV